MNEEFLYYVWKHRLVGGDDLVTTDGEKVQIEHAGIRNTNSGPDFTQARVRVGNTLWAGNVEIHVKASDWLKHRHQYDKDYGNIILHVVYENDLPAKDITSSPTIVLEGKIPGMLRQRYQDLIANQTWIPCEKQLTQIDDFTFRQQLDRLLVERIQNKTGDIIKRLEMNKNNWEETMYQLTAHSFGLKVNAEPFDLLAHSLPLKVIGKHKFSLFHIEALLFGTAGMLEEDFKEDYPISLKKEYHFLRKKYDLQPLEPKLWKFMRLRPPGFPTIRIAQFAMLLHKSKHLFSQILESENANEMKGLFMGGSSTYWHDHYRFDHVSVKRSKTLGENTIDLLIINTIAPLLFVYAEKHARPELKDKALAILDQLQPEKNHIVDGWTTVSRPPRSAFDSQALLQLKNEYCDKRNCLNCAVGNKILRSE